VVGEERPAGAFLCRIDAAGAFGRLGGLFRVAVAKLGSGQDQQAVGDVPVVSALGHRNPFEETSAFRRGRNRTPAEQDKSRMSAAKADIRTCVLSLAGRARAKPGTCCTCKTLLERPPDGRLLRGEAPGCRGLRTANRQSRP
jgi:hypothetical protein